VSLFRKRKNGTYILDKREFSSRLKVLLSFRPGNLRIYEIAFIHRSASFKLPDGQKINNERLEFLGDSVLDMILSDFLFEKYPEAAEGFMTKIRSRIVNRDILNQLAVSMSIDKLLVSNISSGNNTKNLYGDALEALIGAIFLDKGLIKAKRFFIKNVLEKYLDLHTIVNTDNDYKSLVFEWVQKKKNNLTFTYNEDLILTLKNRSLQLFSVLTRKNSERDREHQKKKLNRKLHARLGKDLKIIRRNFKSLLNFFITLWD
jgi:ribonuclease-3